jgi:hypothetical protein
VFLQTYLVLAVTEPEKLDFSLKKCKFQHSFESSLVFSKFSDLFGWTMIIDDSFDNSPANKV